MAETFLFFGPPGSGKSTTIVGEANRAVQAYSERNGCDPAECREVLITSLTRAAKGEIRKRKNQGMLLDPSCVSTLHALAWKACGRPKLIHSKGALDDWNNSCSNPHWTLASLTHRSNSDEGLFGEQDGVMRGDRLYEETSKMRAKMIPREEWPDELIDFHDSFGAWKRASGFADFQDCIERAAETTDEAPGSPRVIFVDEAQDHDRSQFHLLKHWAKGIDKLVVVGDPLQAIYTWRGSDPDAFYELPCQWKRTLPYPAGPTWRVPEAVRAEAIAIAQEIDTLEEGRNRMAMDYRPRELTPELEAQGYTKEGFVHSIETSFSTESGAEIALANASRHLDEGRSVMFLATCAYMLNPLMRLMRERGIAYYNPFITTANSFNPIEYTTPGGTGRRIRAFLRPSEKLFGEDARIWTYEEANLWVDLIKVEGVLRHGAKGKLRQLAEKRPGRYAQLDQRAMTTLFEPEALGELDAALEAGDLSWLMNRLTAGAITEKPRRYLEGLLAASGSEAIVEDPRVIVGTIHCSPGDEPVLSRSGSVEIGCLSDRHRLASYDHRTNRMTWGGRSGISKREEDYGFTFSASRSAYDGRMLTLQTARSRTRVTPTHRVRARLNERFINKWIVYLMKRGRWWRVGRCVSGRSPYRSSGLGGRIATEQADCGWILRVCETRNDAVAWEAMYQSRYGMPSLTFEASESRVLSTQELHAIHEQLSDYTHENAIRLLLHSGLFLDAPMYSRQVRGRPGLRLGVSFETIAANLLSGYMSIPVPPASFASREPPDFLEVSVKEDDFCGDVFSLEVPPFSHYVSGGAVVHNSVKGGEADVVYVSNELSRAGERSYAHCELDTLRAFYVAVTRAKEGLVMCGDFRRGRMGFRWPQG